MKETPKVIDAFENEYGFLSNFWYMSSAIFYDCTMFNYVENAFQAAKYNGRHANDIHQIMATLTPGKAKHLGQALQLRPDWEQVKDQVMEDLLRKKFKEPSLRNRLLDTGDAILIEGNTWHDNYWGSCCCDKCGDKGKNKLGQILMKLRSEYRANINI